MSLTTWARVIKGGARPAATPPGTEEPQPAAPADAPAPAAWDPLSQFRAQAEAILNQAQREAEELRTAGHAEGLARGLAEAQAVIAGEIESRAADLVASACAGWENRVQSLLTELARQHQLGRDQWLARWERGAVELAGDLAARLLGRELACDSGLRVDLIRQVLALAAGAASVRVWVHPEDLPGLSGDCQGAGWQVLSDNQLTPGDCRVEFPSGEIDARLRTQVRRLLEELLPANEGDSATGPGGAWWSPPA